MRNYYLINGYQFTTLWDAEHYQNVYAREKDLVHIRTLKNPEVVALEYAQADNGQYGQLGLNLKGIDNVKK